MNILKNLNLAQKFFIPVSFLIILASSVFSFFFLHHEIKIIKSERINYADSLARNLAYNAEYGVLTKNFEILYDLVKGVMKERDVIMVQIVDINGKVLVTSGENKEQKFFLSSIPVKTKKVEFNQNALQEEIFFGAKTNNSEDIIGKVNIKISYADMQRLLNEITITIITITIIIIIISISLTFVFVEKITLPLKELVIATEKIANGDLRHKVDIKTHDEIGKLANAFNKMVDELSNTLVSRDYVDNIIRSMMDMLIVTNPDATIKKVNQAAIDLLGYSKEELIGKPMRGIFLPDTAASLKEIWIDDFVKKGTVKNVEGYYLAKDGKKIPIIFSASLVCNESGNIEDMVYVALDITERKEFEERIKQSEEQYRSLIETAPDLIFSISITDAVFISLNPAFEKLTGWNREEWIGKPFTDVIHHDDLALAVKVVEAIVRYEISSPCELRVLTKSGDYLIGEFSTAPKFENGNISAVLGIVRDITERKKAEKEKEILSRQLLQSEKMAAIGQLAGGVAHEINNPLGIILGFSQSVMKRITEEDQLFMPLQSIEREAKRCKNLVQDLLTFSRIGKTEKEKCDINEVIKSSLSLIEAQVKIQPVELKKEFTENLPYILISRNQIQQIIVNLCNNAIDAMTKAGKLFIRTMAASKNGTNYIEIQIEDTGTGIPKNLQAKIFEPFFTTKEIGKGTGLGLSVVYEIVQKHEGKIEFESYEGKGTIFKIFLPII